MKIKRGDRVIVQDPAYGEVPGRVVEAGEAGVVVDGPRLDSRVIQYSIASGQLDTHVRPDPGYVGKHRR